MLNCANDECDMLSHYECLDLDAVSAHAAYSNDGGIGETAWYCSMCVSCGSPEAPSNHELEAQTASASDALHGSSDGDDAPTGWPELNELQQIAFQKWFMNSRDKKRNKLEAALEHEVSHAESEQTLELTTHSRERVARARQLQSQLQMLDEMDHMRKESWKFYLEAGHTE